MPVLKTLLGNKIFQLCAFLIASVLYYLPTQRYGMVHDFLGWIIKYQNGSWSDVWTGFGYYGLHPIFHIINYGTFRVFGPDQLSWCIVFALLQGLTSFLLFSTLHEIFRKFHISQAWLIALLASVCFMIGPYQTETVTWKACMHYILSAMFFLLALRCLMSHMWNGRGRYMIVLHHILFIASLLTLEINLVTPFVLMALSIACMRTDDWSMKDYLIKFFVPHFIIIVLYFAANKFLLGDWVGHYGVEKHFNMDAKLIVSNGFSYFFKYLGLVHFWSFKSREVFYQSLTSIQVIGGIFAAIALIIFLLRNQIYRNNNLWLSAVFLIMFFMALVPIVNLYFMYIMPFQNDRYGFFASMFFYPFIFLLLFSLPKILRYVLVAIVFLAHIYFGILNVKKCQEAGQLIDGLISTYEWYDNGEVRLLTLPDNYLGLFLYADYHDNGAETFIEALEIFGSEEVRSNIVEYSQYNPATLQDSFSVVKTEDTITVAFKQYGNWFWRNNIGFINYENDEVKATRSKNILRVEIKDSTDRIMLYPDGMVWKRLDY